MQQSVVLVGAGDWARTALAPAVNAIGGARIAACIDIDADRACRLAAEFDVPHTACDLEAFLKTGVACDAAVISTPDRHHADAVRAAVAAGLAVYCEKPLAASLREAQQLVQLASDHSRPTTVGFSFRYSDAVQRLRSDLVDGTLGAPWLIETQERNSQFHPRVGRAMTWKGDPAHAAGGALVEYGAHIIDLDQWLAGPVTEVTAQLLRVSERSRLDDVATLQLRHATGALGTLATGWVLAGGYPGIRIVVHASNGTAEAVLDDGRDAAETYRRYDLAGRLVDRLDIDRPPRHGYAQRQLADLLALAAGGTPRYPNTLPSIAQAAQVQATLDAALTDGDQRSRPVTQS